MQQPDLKEAFKAVVTGAEETKKAADLLFAHQEYEEAAATYTKACKSLGPIWGFPFGEVVAIRSFANQAQCYLKLGRFEEAAVACDTALSVPSVVHEQHLASKIFKRRGTACEMLGKLPQAMISYDWAMRFGDDTEDTATCRDRVVVAISEKEEGFVAIPPAPETVEKATISKIISAILQSKGDAELVSPLILKHVVEKRAAVDLYDEQKNNLLWAVCQAAIMRSAEEKMEADDVLPLVELLIQNGGRANQRFVIKGAYRTPLQMMAVAGASECCALLLKSGGPMQALDQRGWSALEVACAVDNPRHKSKNPSNHEVVTVLLEHKANPQFKIPASGMTALSLAAQGGDGESVLALLQGGAVVNVRCAVGFSPIVWAMIGNGPKPFKANRAFMVLFHKISECKTPALLDEAREDIKCFHLSAMLADMKSTKKKVIPEGATAAQASTLQAVFHDLLLQNLRRRVGLPPKAELAAAAAAPPAPAVLPPAPPSEGEEASATAEKELAAAVAAQSPHTHATDDANVLLRIVSVLMPQYIPRIMTRKWSVKADHEDKKDILAALGNANPIERCWLSVVMCAVSGPQKSELLLDFSSPLCPATGDEKFGVIGCYADFIELVRAPLSREYSSFIPAGVLLDRIAEARYLVSSGDHGGYWSRLLRMCAKPSAADDPQFCQVLEFNASDSARASFEGPKEEWTVAVTSADGSARVDLTSTEDKPALLVFSEPSAPIDVEAPVPAPAAVIDAKLKSLVKLLDVYHDSDTVILVGQKTGADVLLYENNLAYKVSAAIEAFLIERKFVCKNMNPTAEVEGAEDAAVEDAAEAAEESAMAGEGEAKKVEAAKPAADMGVPLPHWPFEIVRMTVWKKQHSE
jgi:tetratricopeptide (TPR) repeat protein